MNWFSSWIKSGSLGDINTILESIINGDILMAMNKYN